MGELVRGGTEEDLPKMFLDEELELEEVLLDLVLLQELQCHTLNGSLMSLSVILGTWQSWW